MFRRFSINFTLLSIGLDLVTVATSLKMAVLIRPWFSGFSFAADIYSIPQIPTFIYPIFAIMWVIIFLLLSVYDGRKNFFVVDEFTSITFGSILATVSQAGILYFSYRETSRVLFFSFVLLAYLGMLFWRSLVRLSYHHGLGNISGPQTRHVLIVGAGPVGLALRSQVKQYEFTGLKVVGFLDDDDEKRTTIADILGSLEDVCEIIQEYQVEEVIIALPNRAYERINQLVARLHSLPVKVWVIPDYFGLALHKAVVEEFAGMPMMDLRAPALNEYQRLMKRAFDITITLLLLPFALPLMALIAVAIYLEGNGPIFFKQQRVGENGRLFNMIKFRTMVSNAEELRYQVEYRDQQGFLIHKTENDPRVTKVGRFLRRTSLDELPQLLNILKGEMSLVGPRPELPYLVDQYEPWQRKRFAVPQGITGWWQVNGRSDKPMHLHTEDDLYYVQHYSLLLDLYILLKTLGVVVKGKGAY